MTTSLNSTGWIDEAIADLHEALSKTWGSPSLSPYCADKEKYAIMEQIIAKVQSDAGAGIKILGQSIIDLNTVNSVHVTLEDGTWELMHASSNTPQLVVVTESPVAKENMIGMFREIEHRLAEYSEIGAFD